MILGATVLGAAPTAHAARPDACFTQSVANPVPGESVTFDSSCSRDRDSDGRITGRAWDTDDDGRYDDFPNDVSITVQFPAPGTYEVKLGVVDDDGDKDTEARTVRVNAVPSPSFANEPAAPRPGDTVTFISTSSDSDGTIVSYEWALDADGAFDDGTGTSVSRAFPAAGSYTVSLRVTDDHGAQAVATRTIEVAQPDATFPAAPQPPRLLDPFPTVRIRGRTTTRGVNLSLFQVRGPVGSIVKLRCSGRRCAAKRMSARIKSRSAVGSVRFKRLERTLTAGTVLRVYVSQPGLIGKYTRFRIRRLALPLRTDRCLMPGSTKPVTCPGSS